MKRKEMIRIIRSKTDKLIGAHMYCDNRQFGHPTEICGKQLKWFGYRLQLTKKELKKINKKLKRFDVVCENGYNSVQVFRIQ
jgi:hypothetical protein